MVSIWGVLKGRWGVVVERIISRIWDHNLVLGAFKACFWLLGAPYRASTGCTNVRMFVSVYICIHMLIHLVILVSLMCMCTSIYIHLHVHMYYVYIYICICTCIQPMHIDLDIDPFVGNVAAPVR